MASIIIFQVDAFTDKVFSGNPAAVCPLEEWLDDRTLLNIASENNLSETAFFKIGSNPIELRWFTPKFEIDLCGHATLATAHVLYNHLGATDDILKFSTESGPLTVERHGNGLAMNFPSWVPEQMGVPSLVVEGLNAKPKACYKTRDCLALFDSEEDILDIDPDFGRLMGLDFICIIATAPGKNSDFVSRVFAPRAGVPEDPVTGSAHSTLIPFWADRLGKNDLKAVQLSKRRGYLDCSLKEDRVIIRGNAVTFLKGEITL